MPLNRRDLLRYAAVGAAAWPAVGLAGRRSPAVTVPTPPSVDPFGAAGTTSDPETMTLEAWSDTLIPGHKRWDGDYAIAGAMPGPGAVQAGAVQFMRFPPVGVATALPGIAAAIDGEAAGYAAQHRRALDPTLPPFVALDFRDRTRLVHQLVDGTSGDQQLFWFALAGLVFLAYHTAGYLPTADAVRRGHPGLKAIRFPEPDPDGLWRFPHASYHRDVARPHPRTSRTGSPP